MRQCQQCNESIPPERNAKAKFCTEKCSKAAYRRSSKPCTLDGCERKIIAKGLCGTHYNQKYYPNRHPKHMVPCAWCETPTLKGSGGGRKHGAVCSEQCRSWLRFGYSVLPADHWARWYGKSSEWTPPKPSKPPAFTSEERACVWCETTFTAKRSDHMACTRKCKAKAAAVRRRGREHAAPGSYTWAEVMRVWVSLGKCCSYCNEPATTIDPDHVVPLSRGGSNSITNITPSCRLCNSDKRDLLLHEWYIDRARRGLPPRQLDARIRHLTHARLIAA